MAVTCPEGPTAPVSAELSWTLVALSLILFLISSEKSLQFYWLGQHFCLNQQVGVESETITNEGQSRGTQIWPHFRQSYKKHKL